MIVTADASRTAIGRQNKREVVVAFSPASVAAPFLLRCGAAFVDYILVVAPPVLGLVLNRLIGSEYGSPEGALSNNTAWLIAVLLGLSNLLLFPILTGQTVGMMLVGIRIVSRNGRDASIGKIVVRNTLGYLLTLATLGLGFLLSAVVPSGRALHDYLTGTVVIFAKKKVL